MPDRNRTPEPANYDGTGEQPGVRRKPKAPASAEEDSDRIWSSNVDPDYGRGNDFRENRRNVGFVNSSYNIDDIL